MATATTTLPAAGTWTFDKAHTQIGFAARHLMVTKVRGHVAEFDGTVTVADRPEESHAEVVMQAASITTGTIDRDNHLRSPDFFDVANFPTLRFKSTKIERNGFHATLSSFQIGDRGQARFNPGTLLAYKVEATGL